MSIPSTIPSIPKATSDTLSLITDPYHDYNLRASGFPDGKPLISAVQRFAGRYDVACPFTLAASETWDFHIFTTPLHSVSRMYPGTTDALYCRLYASTASSAQDIGPINVLYRKYTAAGVVNDTVLIALPAISTDIDSQRRTVSFGFELHNTTAELYKSGSLSIYRQPVLAAPTNMTLKTTGTVELSEWSGFMIAQVPYTIADVQLLPNSRTWEAKDGAYCVCLPNYNNPFSSLFNQNLVVKAGIQSDSVLFQRRLIDGYFAPLPTYSPLAGAGVMSSKYKDANQTFVLDFRQILESIPASTNTSLLSFSTTAPQADLAFLKIYKRMFNNIPPGVPVHFNAAGDWFRAIIKVVKDVLPMVASSLPGSFKPIAVAATPIISNLIDKALDKKINVTQRMVSPSAIKKQMLAKSKPKQKKRKQGKQ